MTLLKGQGGVCVFWGCLGVAEGLGGEDWGGRRGPLEWSVNVINTNTTDVHNILPGFLLW